MNENAPATPPPSAPALSPSTAGAGSSVSTTSDFAPLDSSPDLTSVNESELAKEKPLNSTIADIIEKIISHIPDSVEPTSATPDARARHIVSRASTMAALVSGGLAIPPGGMAIATILPDLYAIWKIQSHMVADIAAAYGRKADLRREHMLYCLFRHITSQIARDVAVRVGQRIFIRPGTIAIMNRIFSLVGREVTQRIVARTASSWVPFFGAAAVGGYAWYDTRKVGHTAMALFQPNPSVATVDPAAPTVEEVIAENRDAATTPAGATPGTADGAASAPSQADADLDVLDIGGFVDLPPVPQQPSDAEPGAVST